MMNRQTYKQTERQKYNKQSNSKNLNWSWLSHLRLSDRFEKKQTDKQTNRQINKQTNRLTGLTDRHTDIRTYKQSYLSWSQLRKLRFSDRFEKTDRQTDRQKECHTDRQDKQIDIWT